MTPGRWQEVERLYHELVDLDPGIRAERLAAIGDDALRAEVASLLDAGPLDPAFADAMRHVATDAGAGHRFGAWRTIRAIGEGGMGVVYEGVRADGAFAKTVAIKVLHGGASAVRSHERFRQERDILARLDHPNIARLIDGGETAAGEPFIVMEYVSGLPIGAWCIERALVQEDIIRLFLRVCLAVQYAHQNRVIHRDLKPANILVTESGEPKLLDFGIAKLLDPDALLTSTGMHALTPDFASPEQVQGASISAATDVYSLGLVLYELLTGRRPYVFTQSSPAAIARTICDVEPAPPRLGGDLDRILLMSLRKEPARRYASVAAFTADLENFLEDRPITARQDTMWYRTTRFIVRNRLGVAAGAAVFIALSAGVAVSQYQARRAQRRFDQVRGLANDLLNHIDARLRDLPGTTAAREEAIRTTLAYLEPLARDASDDVALQVEVASAYARVGELQQSLGDDAARASFESAIRLVGLAAADRQPAAVTVLAIAHGQFAYLLYVRGDTKGAADHARAALQVVTDAQFSDQRMFAPAVRAESFLGRIEMESGHTGRALRLLEHAVDTGTRALKVTADEDTLQQVVAAQINLRSEVTLLGDLPRARQLALDTQQLVRAYYAGKPATAASRQLRLEAYAVAAGDTLPLDMPARLMSKAEADEAVALAESLSSAEPNNVSVGVWRQIAYEQECDVARTDSTRAVEWCQRSVEAADRLAEGNPRNTLFRRNRGLQHASLADALRRSGAHVDAAEHATLAQRDLESSFDDQESKAGVIVAMLIVGDLQLDEGDYQRAATRYERGRALAESLVAADPDDMRAAAFLAMACEGLGRSAAGRRDPATAAQWFTKAVNVWASWPTKAASSEYDQSHLHQAERLRAAVAR